MHISLSEKISGYTAYLPSAKTATKTLLVTAVALGALYFRSNLAPFISRYKVEIISALISAGLARLILGPLPAATTELSEAEQMRIECAVKELVSQIRKEIQTEGLFKLSGDDAKLDSLADQIIKDENTPTQEIQALDVISQAHLLKKLLKKFDGIIKLDDKNITIPAFMSAKEALNETAREILNETCSLLAEVLRNYEQTKMDPVDLAQETHELLVKSKDPNSANREGFLRLVACLIVTTF